MAYQFKDHNDIKIFILYLLKNVGRPLCYNELNDVVAQDELVNYIDFAECVGELVDTGNIRTTLTPDGLTYEITPQGIKVADTLESGIDGYIRTTSLKSAMRYLSFKERGIRIAVTTSPREDGRIDLTVTIKEKTETLMSLSLIADNDYQARKMSYHFQSQPETVYRSIFALLSGEANYLLS